jgi:hypothetical protein
LKLGKIAPFGKVQEGVQIFAVKKLAYPLVMKKNSTAKAYNHIRVGL